MKTACKKPVLFALFQFVLHKVEYLRVNDCRMAVCHIVRQKGYGSFTWYHRRFQPVTTVRQNSQKLGQKFCSQKTAKKRKTHPIQPEKGEPGCVLGAGEDGNGWGRVKPDEKTRSPNQREPHSHTTHEKRKPAETQSFRRFFGRGRRTCLGCRLGRFAAERHWRSLTPRHALRRAQPHLVAESLCALTKNREASIVLASLFLAGAEGVEPSARGFGVDVGKRTGERGRGGATRFPPQAAERAVLVWCYGKFSGPKRAKKSGKSPKKREILLTKTDTVPIL